MRSAAIFLIRLSPVLFVTFAAAVYVLKVEAGVAYPFRNLAPMLVVILLAVVTLAKGGGRWTGAGWQWLLAACCF